MKKFVLDQMVLDMGIRFTKKSRQTGQASIELVMSLLLFVAMLGTLLSLSLYMYINHTFLTAAKEGARRAAVESALANPATQASGVSNVKQWVQNFVSSSSSIALQDDNINVTGPTDAGNGSRTVTVTVSYQFDNPVKVRTFMDRLSGGNADGLDTFQITNSATMRYEE